MHHPLVDLVRDDIPAPERDELSRSLHTLDLLGWRPQGVQRAINAARDVAGQTLADESAVVVCCDEEPLPHVSVGLPVYVSPKEANHLSARLREQLERRELNRPGLSITFWSTQPALRNRQNERHR
jgi:hypothetical protein